jgi:hypothetical protein
MHRLALCYFIGGKGECYFIVGMCIANTHLYKHHPKRASHMFNIVFLYNYAQTTLPPRFLPDSLHWYVATNKHEKAEQWILKAQKFNRVKFPIANCLYTDEQTLIKSNNDAQQRKSRISGTVFEIATSLPLTVQTIVMLYLW